MPTILLNREKKVEVVIFTHKEYLQIFKMPNWSRRHLLARPDQVLGWFIGHFFKRRVLERLQNKIAIGVHWGYLTERPIDGKLADFHLADLYQAEFIDGNCQQGFQSRDFSEGTFKATRSYFDFVTISHNSRRKNLDIMMTAAIRVAEKCEKMRFLFVVNTPSSKFRKDTRTTSVGFLKQYLSLSDDMKNRIVLCRASDELGNFGFSISIIKMFLERSKCLVLWSNAEGNAKVVSEALASGCTIIGNSVLRGGTFDIVPDSKKELGDDLEKLLYSSLDSNNGDFETALGDTSKVNDFQRYLESLGVKIEKEQLVFLDKKLPGLYRLDYPWLNDYPLSSTVDLKSIKSWKIFNKWISMHV